MPEHMHDEPTMLKIILHLYIIVSFTILAGIAVKISQLREK